MKLYIGYKEEKWPFLFLIAFLLLSSCRKDPIPPPVTPPYNGPVLCKTKLEQISVPANNMDTTVYNVGCGAIPEAEQLYPDYLYTYAVFNPENVNQIAYIREPTNGTLPTGERQLWIYDICSGQSQKIYDNVNSRICWGRNGWILFSTYIGPSNSPIFKIRPDGTSLTQLTQSGTITAAFPFSWNKQGDGFIFLAQVAGPDYLLTADENGVILDTVHNFANGMMFMWSWLQGDTLLVGKTPSAPSGNPSLYLYNSGLEISYFNNSQGGGSDLKIYSDLSYMVWRSPTSINKSTLTTKTVLRTGASNREYNSLDLSSDNQYVIFSRRNQRNPEPCYLYTEDKIYIMSTDGSYERELILP